MYKLQQGSIAYVLYELLAFLTTEGVICSLQRGQTGSGEQKLARLDAYNTPSIGQRAR
jgi:hypothetical protein